MEILYKVVGKRHRYGSNMTGYLRSKTMHHIKLLFKTHPMLKPYFPQYKKGAIIETVPGSVGLLCFDSKKNAEEFIYNYENFETRVKIVRVKPLSNVSIGTNIKVNGACMSIPLLLINPTEPKNKISPPTGTVFVSKVQVLD